MIRSLLSLMLVIACLLTPTLPGQTAAPTSPPPSTPAAPLSLPQLEATYQAELKKIHVQLLGGYVTDLQRLAATSRSAETTVAINEELRRVQAIISSGGVIDLQKAATEVGKTEKKAAEPVPAPPAAARALMTLGPALASKIVPEPKSPQEAPAITAITWIIEALPRGEYEIVAQASLQTLEEAATLELTLDRKLLQFPLLPRHLASAPGDFRLLRLGRIELPLDIKDSPLELVVTPVGARADLRLRQLFITRASSTPSPSPPSPSQP